MRPGSAAVVLAASTFNVFCNSAVECKHDTTRVPPFFNRPRQAVPLCLLRRPVAQSPQAVTPALEGAADPRVFCQGPIQKEGWVPTLAQNCPTSTLARFNLPCFKVHRLTTTRSSQNPERTRHQESTDTAQKAPIRIRIRLWCLALTTLPGGCAAAVAL